jgi:hypothetical protein
MYKPYSKKNPVCLYKYCISIGLTVYLNIAPFQDIESHNNALHILHYQAQLIQFVKIIQHTPGNSLGTAHTFGVNIIMNINLMLTILWLMLICYVQLEIFSYAVFTSVI